MRVYCPPLLITARPCARSRSNTFWSSNAESAIVFAESTNIDELDIVKMIIRNNVVFDNQNKIPYYNAKCAAATRWQCLRYSSRHVVPLAPPVRPPLVRPTLMARPWRRYDDPQYLIAKNMHVARENYGSALQDFIIDGSGVYITRNSQVRSR